MNSPAISEHIKCLRERITSDGGFAARPDSGYRPDATAWAVLALAAAGFSEATLSPARSRLAADQLNNGGVSIAPDHPDAFWPTPLAVLAWHGSPPHHTARTRAVTFLLNTTGNHWRKDPSSPHAHDTSLRGWPWVAQNHSWVEPTSVALLALQVAGCGTHSRVQEGVRMLMDRQLSLGGWNIGSKAVYGQEPHPFPDCTGMALSALAGHVSKSEVQPSIAYLKKRISSIRSPLSLGWGLLGLGAWGERPPQAKEWIRESLGLQASYGPYDTSLLSLLLIAFMTDRSLADIISTRET